MTDDQIKWASNHDWFIRQDGNGVLVKDYWVNLNHNVVSCEEFFDDFKKLKEWAGY